MKKYMFIACLMLAAISSFAQESDALKAAAEAAKAAEISETDSEEIKSEETEYAKDTEYKQNDK